MDDDEIKKNRDEYVRRKVLESQENSERLNFYLNEEQRALKKGKRKKLLAATTMVFLGAAVTFVVIRLVIGPFWKISAADPTPSGFVIIGVTGGIAAALLLYLRDNSSSAEIPASNAALFKRLRDIETQLKGSIIHLTERVNNMHVDEDTRNEIISKITEQLQDVAISSTLTDFAERNLEAQRQASFSDKLREEHVATTVRLSNAIKNLQRRANINLVFGIVLSLLGVYLLWQALSSPARGDSVWDFARSYLPRLSLVLIIEIFSYFFLNLYKSSLSETRYYQNELTNISSRRLSLVCALEIEDKKTLSTVVADLSKTERNNILSKGQSTFELERVKLESESSKNLTGLVEKLLQSLIAAKKE
ncbi:hypothetical protein [Burkholderia territorii]|uniref:hypothetical protein n=1 Tax=Burkholderia territorii TaxID=1503055 RepID=UPI000B1D25EB|nr:hypothetical protein [Burkholderia territorii]